MRTVSGGLTDVGRRRPHNEDAFACDDALGLYVVADGVGGHAKGEVASAESVDHVVGWVRRHLGDIDLLLATGSDEGVGRVRRLLESGIQSACYIVFGMAEMDPDKRGMSTTLSAMLIRQGRVFIAQVGDSRVYRLRGTVLQLTEDHTLINFKLKLGLITADEAKRAGGKNVITRAVGHKDYVQVDTLVDDALPGDRYLLCTDGLHGYLENDDDVVTLMSTEPIEAAVRRAVGQANDRGGRDNITVVLVSVLP